MDNLSSICKLGITYKLAGQSPGTLSHQTESHINNPSLPWPGQNLSRAERKRLFSLKGLRRSGIKMSSQSHYQILPECLLWILNTHLFDFLHWDPLANPQLQKNAFLPAQSHQIRMRGKHKLSLFSIWTTSIRPG